MKKVVLGLLLSVSFVFAGEIHWIKDFAAAVATSKKVHKPIIFVATKDGCKYCKMLKTTTLKDKDVVSMINKNFVPLKLNLSHSDSLLPYMLAVYTKGFPTIWFLNEEGKPLFEPVGGFLEAKDMKKVLQIVDNAYNKRALQKGAKK